MQQKARGIRERGHGGTALVAACLVVIASWFPTARAGDAAGSAAKEKPATNDMRDGTHDFDFNFGTWTTHVSRLVDPLSGSTTWVEYDGLSIVRKVWGGRASLFELTAEGPAGRIEGVGLRLYNPKSRQWSLNWASSRDGTLETPMIGEFRNGRGEFYDRETFNGHSIYARNGFYDITPTSARFEQAYSVDGGKTWETNWVMTFTRIDVPCRSDLDHCLSR